MKKLSKFLALSLAVLVVSSNCWFEVQAEGTKETLFVEEVFHTHLGTAGQTSANGCYTVAQSKPETVYKGGGYNTEAYEGNYYVAYLKCGYCGWSEMWYKDERDPSTGAVIQVLVRKDTSTMTHAAHAVTENVTRYYAGCGYEDGVAIGSVEFVKSVSTSYVLGVEMTDNLTPVSYAWSTGSTASSIEVTANDTYSVDVVYKEGTNQYTKTFSYTVTDYDTEPPIVSGVTYDSSRASGVDVSVSATDNMVVKEYLLEK